MMIPQSDEYKVPGADDAAIQGDILATLGRDTKQWWPSRSIISRASRESRLLGSMKRSARPS